MSISAQIETVKGIIKISFFPTEAPVTVTNFVNLSSVSYTHLTLPTKRIV